MEGEIAKELPEVERQARGDGSPAPLS